MFKFNRQAKAIDRHAKTMHKIEKALLEARTRNTVLFNEESDSFFITDIISNTTSRIEEKDNYLISEDQRITEAAWEAMTLIYKNQYSKFLPQIYYFLEDPDSGLREQAITTLENFPVKLLLPELKGKLLQMWTDKSEDYTVRSYALTAWGNFYRNSYDRNILSKMYLFLITKELEPYFRYKIFKTIFKTVGEELSHTEDVTLYNRINDLEMMENDGQSYNEEEFNSVFNWERINAIMKKYAPGDLHNDKKIEN